MTLVEHIRKQANSLKYGFPELGLDEEYGVDALIEQVERIIPGFLGDYTYEYSYIKIANEISGFFQHIRLEREFGFDRIAPKMAKTPEEEVLDSDNALQLNGILMGLEKQEWFSIRLKFGIKFPNPKSELEEKVNTIIGNDGEQTLEKIARHLYDAELKERILRRSAISAIIILTLKKIKVRLLHIENVPRNIMP